MRFALALLAVGCAPAIGSLVPPTRPSEAAAPFASLVARLGGADLEDRERAASELARLAADDAWRDRAVEALRGAAAHEDAEVRSRALDVLRAIDRSESLLPGTGQEEPTLHVAGAVGGVEQSIRMWLRAYADGSVEMDVRINEGPRELFSGASFAEVAGRLNEAARERGIPEGQFRVEPDGRYRIAGVRASFENPDERVVPEWGIGVRRASKSDGLSPPEAWGGWVIVARSASGRAWRAGLGLRDVVTAVDERPAETVAELRSRMAGARTLTVLRPAHRVERVAVGRP